MEEVIDRIISNSKVDADENLEEEEDILADLAEDPLDALSSQAFYYMAWPDEEFCSYVRFLALDTVQSEIEAIVYSVRHPEGEIIATSWPPGEVISFSQFQAAEDAGWAPLVDQYFEITYEDGFVEWAHTRYPADCESLMEARIFSEFTPDGMVAALRWQANVEIAPIAQEAFDEQVEALWQQCEKADLDTKKREGTEPRPPWGLRR